MKRIDHEDVQHHQHYQRVGGGHMHEQPALGKPEVDTREIEPVLLDHQVLDRGKLFLALLVDIA